MAIVAKNDSAVKGFISGKLSSCMAILLSGDKKLGLLHLDIYRNPETTKALILKHFGKLETDYDLNYFISPIFVKNIQTLLTNLPKFRQTPDLVYTLPNKLEASLYSNLLLFEKIFGRPLDPKEIISDGKSTCISFEFDNKKDGNLKIKFLPDAEYESLVKRESIDNGLADKIAGAAFDVTKLFSQHQPQLVYQQYISGVDTAPDYDIPDNLKKDLALETTDYSEFSMELITKLSSVLAKYNPPLADPKFQKERSALAVEALSNIQKYFTAKRAIEDKSSEASTTQPSASATSKTNPIPLKTDILEQTK